MANIVLMLCILAGPVALGIVVLIYGLELPRRRATFPMVMAAPPRPQAPPQVADRSTDFAVEETVVVNHELAAVVPAMSHRPSRPDMTAVAPPAAVPTPAPMTAAPVARPQPPAPRLAPPTPTPAPRLPAPTAATAVEVPRVASRRPGAPPPLPRRVPRGTDPPSSPVAQRFGEGPFAGEASTLSTAFEEMTDVEDHTSADAAPWQMPPRNRFVTAS